MAWNDPSETIIGGNGQVYVAPVGTALPANESASLNAAFNGLGYHTEDGLQISTDVEISEHMVWQSKTEVRRAKESEEFTISFTLVQFNEVTVPLALGGGTVTDLGSSHYKISPPTVADALQERALIADVADGSRLARFVIPKGTITEGVEIQFNRSDMSGLDVSFKALEPDDGGLPWYWLSNDSAAFATGS